MICEPLILLLIPNEISQKFPISWRFLTSIKQKVIIIVPKVRYNRHSFYLLLDVLEFFKSKRGGFYRNLDILYFDFWFLVWTCEFYHFFVNIKTHVLFRFFCHLIFFVFHNFGQSCLGIYLIFAFCEVFWRIFLVMWSQLLLVKTLLFVYYLPHFKLLESPGFLFICILNLLFDLCLQAELVKSTLLHQEFVTALFALNRHFLLAWSHTHARRIYHHIRIFWHFAVVSSLSGVIRVIFKEIGTWWGFWRQRAWILFQISNLGVVFQLELILFQSLFTHKVWEKSFL